MSSDKVDATDVVMKADTTSDKANYNLVSESLTSDADEKSLQSDKLDDATIFVNERRELYGEIDPVEEKKAIRKNDWVLVSILFVTGTSGATDKQAWGTAAIYGMREDANLDTYHYAWANAAIFLGSLAGVWPMSYMMSRYPIGKVLACAALLWAIMTLLLPACHNFGGFFALRFLMGFFEAAIVPGCTLIVGRFYKKKEQPVRLAIVFAFGSSLVNGFLSWLVGNFGTSLAKWKWLFILIGILSFAWALFMIYFLPDSPMNAIYLNDKERYILTLRVMENKTGVQHNEFKWYQVRHALLDIKTHVIFFFNFAINIPNGGLNAFSAIIINGLGFDSKESSLMTMPNGVIATISTIFFNWLCGKTHNKRSLWSIVSLIFPIIGAALSYSVDEGNIGARLVGLYFMYFYFCSYVILISLSSANAAGSTRRSVTVYYNYLGYAAGALTGSHVFDNGFTGGFIAMLVAYCACILLSALYWLIATFENRQKMKAIRADPVLEAQYEAEKNKTDEDDNSKVLTDLTDREQKTFLYTL